MKHQKSSRCPGTRQISVIDELDRHLKLFHNYLEAIDGTLRSNQRTIKDKIRKLRRKIEEITSNLKEIEDAMEGFKKKADNEIKKLIGDFREKSRKYIFVAFGKEEKTISTTSPNPWINLLLHQIHKAMNTHIIKSTNRGEVVSALQTINNNISKILTDDLDVLANNLQTYLYQQQVDLINNLNQRVIPLTREIEREIGETLNINLHPIDVKVELPKRQEFLAKLIQDSDGIITTEKGAFHITFKGKKIWGWLPFFDVKLYDPDEYVISSKKYQQMFQKQLDEMTEFWLSVLNDHVVNEFRPLLGSIETELENYAESYLTVINDNILSGEQRDEKRANRIDAIGVYLTDQSELIDGIDYIRQSLR